MNKRRVVTVICPACRKKGDWFAGPYGPFCSQRCRLIDLGKWFGGEHAISEPLRAEHLQALEGEKDASPDNN
jgi:endogenous inhibitor of DNA gyrase (YacG/DUF329 family)